MRIIALIFFEIIGFITTLYMYPLLCYFKSKSKIFRFTKEETNYEVNSILKTERVYAYLIVTIPCMAIFIRCTYVEILNDYAGLFIGFCTFLMVAFLYLYTYVLARLQSSTKPDA